jgi:uncharacterized membrane-anchored protein YitT (DUF2179 family)
MLVSGVTLLLLFLVNLPVYRFFWRQRGLSFALATIPWHWLYYGYSGLAFVVGVARFLLCRQREPRHDETGRGKPLPVDSHSRETARGAL